MPASWPLKTSVDRVDPCRVIIADATHSLTTSLVSFRVPGTHRRQLRHRLLAPVNRFSTTSRSSPPNNLLPPHFPQFLLYNRQRHTPFIVIYSSSLHIWIQFSYFPLYWGPTVPSQTYNCGIIFSLKNSATDSMWRLCQWLNCVSCLNRGNCSGTE